MNLSYILCYSLVKKADKCVVEQFYFWQKLKLVQKTETGVLQNIKTKNRKEYKTVIKYFDQGLALKKD